MAKNFLDYDYKKNTVIEIFNNSVKNFGDRTFLKSRDREGWKDLSWNEVAAQVEALASYLINAGLKKEGMISIYSTNRPEWVVADLATLSAACVDATIYPTNSATEAAYVLKDSKSVICFCEGKFQVDNIISKRSNLPSLKKIVVFDDPGYKDDMIISFADALKEGASNLQKEEIQNRTASIRGTDLMTLIYSSGTTGQPKGVMLSHSNIMFITLKFNMRQNLPEGHIILSLLPLSHAVERTMDYYSTILDGGVIAYSRGTEFFAQDLIEIRPNLGIYVPRVFEKIYNVIMGKLKEAPAGKQKIFSRAIEIGKQAAPYFMEAKSLPLILRLKYGMYDKLVFSKLRKAIGFDRAIGFGAAGAPLMPEIHDFFWGMKIQIRKGYGLTETSPVLNVDGDPGIMSIKSDGWITPFPETEMKIAEDGEILVRGPQIMLGYFNRPQESQDMFTPDGWLKTGDIGIMDLQGYLKITDRKKDIIVTAGGKNVAPQVLENVFSSHPMIEQTAVLGDGKKYIVALIVPDFEALKAWASAQGIKAGSTLELINNKKVISRYEEVVEQINQHFGRVEQIKKFRLMSREFTQEEEELTPTLKLKRKIIMTKYKKIIDSLYLE